MMVTFDFALGSGRLFSSLSQFPFATSSLQLLLVFSLSLPFSIAILWSLDDSLNIKISRIKSSWIIVLNGAWMNQKEPTRIRQSMA
jgi:hypothetical protein